MSTDFSWGSEPGPRALVGYDGSLGANIAIDVGTTLLPEARACVAHLWTVPFPDTGARQYLSRQSATVTELADLIEREGAHQANRVARIGATLARAAGWQAAVHVRRTFGSEGLALAALAEGLGADLVVVGARGLSGTKALLGSVSDLLVHHAPKPALVVPYPLMSAEYEAATDGPVLVAWDGSAGARAALQTAGDLFPARKVVVTAVGPDEDASDLDTAALPDRDVTRERRGGRTPTLARGVAGELSSAARDHTAALIVVGSRGRGPVREILLGSVAMATLHHAHRPVLVVPLPSRQRNH